MQYAYIAEGEVQKQEPECDEIIRDIRNSRLIRSHFGEFESRESCQDDSARSTRSSYKIDVSLVRTDTLTETFQIIIKTYVFR